MQNLDELVKKFSRFPGIGQRQARRFVFYLLQKNQHELNQLADMIKGLHRHMKQCAKSYQFFYTENTQETLSPIERNPERNHEQLLIVEKDMDIEAFEKSHVYKGKYFVLGALFSQVSSAKAGSPRVQQLLHRIEEMTQNNLLKEVILGLSITPEGEHTRMLLLEYIRPLSEKYGFQVVRLGRGLSTGTELEYSDPETIQSALETRI